LIFRLRYTHWTSIFSALLFPQKFYSILKLGNLGDGPPRLNLSLSNNTTYLAIAAIINMCARLVLKFILLRLLNKVLPSSLMQLFCVPGVALPACDVSAHLPPHFRRVLPELHGSAPLHLGECPVRGRASGRLLQVLREGVHLQPAAVSHLSVSSHTNLSSAVTI
jgi:hypothetical protein